MNQTTTEWITEKLSDYSKNKQETIEDMLAYRNYRSFKIVYWE